VEESEYSEGKDLFEHDVAYSTVRAPIGIGRLQGNCGKANILGRSSARYATSIQGADLDGWRKLAVD